MLKKDRLGIKIQLQDGTMIKTEVGTFVSYLYFPSGSKLPNGWTRGFRYHAGKWNRTFSFYPEHVLFGEEEKILDPSSEEYQKIVLDYLRTLMTEGEIW